MIALLDRSSKAFAASSSFRLYGDSTISGVLVTGLRVQPTSVFVVGGGLPLEANQDMMVVSPSPAMKLSCEYVVSAFAIQWRVATYSGDVG